MGHPTLAEDIRVENCLREAMTEIVSAMSALNMAPCPMEGVSQRDDEGFPRYLSETDRWAHHAMEHMHSVLELIKKFEMRYEGERHERLLSKVRKAKRSFIPFKDGEELPDLILALDEDDALVCLAEQFGLSVKPGNKEG